NCTGSGATCPADAKSTAVCRPAADVCDAAESCDGTHNDCPTDTFKPASTQCRAAAGACDLAESCTGSGTSCPADTKSTAVCPPDVRSAAICRAAGNECDLTERCDGISTSCPDDMVQADGTPCHDSDGMSCTSAACVQGQCNQRYQSSCGCDLDVTKAGCV